MTRTSKQNQRRAVSPKKCKPPQYKKTGPVKDNLSKGFREHPNALGDAPQAKQVFIAKVR